MYSSKLHLDYMYLDYKIHIASHLWPHKFSDIGQHMNYPLAISAFLPSQLVDWQTLPGRGKNPSLKAQYTCIPSSILIASPSYTSRRFAVNWSERGLWMDMRATRERERKRERFIGSSFSFFKETMEQPCTVSTVSSGFLERVITEEVRFTY